MCVDVQHGLADVNTFGHSAFNMLFGCMLLVKCCVFV